MTEYIDKTEAMRRFKPFGREIPKEQVMAVLARIDEGIVRCKDCKWWADEAEGDFGIKYGFCEHPDFPASVLETTHADFCSYGERREVKNR